VESAIFLFTRRVLAFFRVNPAKVLINPIFLIGAPGLINRRVNLGLTRGNREGGGGKKIKKSESFLFEASCSQRRRPRRVGMKFFLAKRSP